MTLSSIAKLQFSAKITFRQYFCYDVIHVQLLNARALNYEENGVVHAGTLRERNRTYRALPALIEASPLKDT